MVLGFYGLSACAATGDIRVFSAQEVRDVHPAVNAILGAATEAGDTSSSEEAAPPPRPQSLVGLTSEALEDLLGTPTHMTREPPAQIWRYSIDICRLFFFIYDSVDDGLPTVRHVEVAVAGGAQIQPYLCLSGIKLSGRVAEPIQEMVAD